MSGATDERRLRDIIADECEAKEIRLDELAKKSGLATAYLDAIMSDVHSRVPAFPYIRQQLFRVAEILEVPHEVIIAAYRRDFADKFSGARDTLPPNRFALPSVRRMHARVGGIVIALMFCYLILRGAFSGGERLVIEMPPADQSIFTTSSSTLLLVGRTGSADTVLINEQEVPVAADGSFRYEYPLVPEMNSITFSVRRFLGGDFEVTRKVFFEDSATENVAPAAVEVAPSTSGEE